MLASTVTSKGQVTLPANLRRQFGIKPSDKVLFVKENNKIFLEKILPLSKLFGSLANQRVKPLTVDKMKLLINKGLFKSSK